MEPFFWASGGRETGNGIPLMLGGGPLDAASFPMVEAGSWYRVLAVRSAKEIEFVRIQGEPFFIARGVERDPVLISANPFEIRRTPFSVESSDRKSTRLNSSHLVISYAVFCLKKKKNTL